MGLFSRKSSASSRLADAVAADVADAFARFVANRGDESIVALALCSVDDAVPPYIMGATLDDIGPITGTENTWRADPADWSWSDQGNKYRYDKIIAEMLKHQSLPYSSRSWSSTSDLKSGNIRSSRAPLARVSVDSSIATTFRV